MRAPPSQRLGRTVAARRLHVADRRLTDLRDRARIAKDTRFDGIKDFAPIATIGNVPNVLVVPADRPYKTLPELISAIKAADGAMTFASVGQGSLPQLLGVLLQQRAGLKLVHVPYGGAAPATVDLVAGRIDLAFLNLPPLLPNIQSGKLRAIAVAQNKRADALPDVSTMAELGYPDFEMSTWYGIVAPAGTPQRIIQKLDAAIAETLKQPAVRAKLVAQGNELFYKIQPILRLISLPMPNACCR